MFLSVWLSGSANLPCLSLALKSKHRMSVISDWFLLSSSLSMITCWSSSALYVVFAQFILSSRSFRVCLNWRTSSFKPCSASSLANSNPGRYDLKRYVSYKSFIFPKSVPTDFPVEFLPIWGHRFWLVVRFLTL